MDDDFYRCGCICLAAKKLGYRLAYRERDGIHAFMWLAMADGTRYACQARGNKKDALIAACDRLVEELKI